MSNTVADANLALRSLHWAARFGSIVSIVIILMFFIGEGFNPTRVSVKEWIGLAFFPFGVMVGMVLAWWKEGPGGILATLSLIAFYLQSLLVFGRLPGGLAFIVFTAPAFLFLVHWLATKNESRR